MKKRSINCTVLLTMTLKKEEEVIIKADVTRREEIEEMKMGWEKAQPGRAKMAEDLRSSYLARLDELTKTFLELIKAQKLKVEKYEDISDVEEEILTKSRKSIISGINITDFRRYQLKKQAQIIADLKDILKPEEYEAFSLELSSWFAKERINRNESKSKQYQIFVNIYEAINQMRIKIQAEREVYRAKLLEIEKEKQEKIAAELALLEAAKKPAHKKKKIIT